MSLIKEKQNIEPANQNKENNFVIQYKTKLEQIKNQIQEYFSKKNEVIMNSERDIMTVDLDKLTGLIMVRQSQISPFIKRHQEFVQVSGLLIKIDCTDNFKKIFLKLLSLDDFVTTYKIAACFFDQEEYEFAKNHLKLFDYIRTKPESNFNLII